MFCNTELIGVFRISLRSFSAAVALSVIAGCGGGGGGSSNVSTSTFAVSVAMKNLVSNGYTASFSVSGTLNGANLTGTGSETLTPSASSSFENQPAFDVGDQITYNLQWKGQTANWTDTYHIYFNQSSYALTGKVDSSGGYAVNTSFVWPSTAHVGDSAALGSETYYSDSTKTSIIGSTTLNYSIEADTATTAILAITTVYKDSGNTISETDIDRYRVTPAGEINWVSRSISSSTDGSTAKFTLTAVSVNPPAFNTLPSITPAPPSAPAPTPTATPAPTSNPTPPTPTSLSVLSQSVAYQVDPAHSGQIAFPAALNFPAAASWSVTLAGEVSYPIVVNGTVYVTTAGNPGGSGTQFYALDVTTGNTKWGPIQIAGTYPWSGIAYDNGKVFVINTDGMLRSFDAVTGAAGWAVKLPNQYMFSAPPTATKGIVYVGGSGAGGTLYAVNESSGSILWSASVMNGDKSSPAVSNEGVFVTYPCQGYDFDPSSGIRYWNFSNGCEGGGGRTPVYSNGKIFMRNASISNDNVVLDVQTGSQLWNFTASTIPAIGSSTGYFLSGTTLKAIDLTNQNQLWSFTGDGTLVSAPIILNSVVITASSSGKVFAVDAGTGAQVWSANIGAAAEAPDEQNISKPLTGIGAGAGYLIVPAGNVLSAWYLQ